MCGICGIASISDHAPRGAGEHHAPSTRALRMRDRLTHRGPDDVGLHESRGAVFGAARLAIRGGAEAVQPILDSSGVMVVCNGEIDNHRELATWLKTRGRKLAGPGDLAVLPGLYLELGAGFVDRLEGAFALALWDPRHRCLLLARDRCGERPLFYARGDDEVAFASELSVLALDRGAQCIDHRALHDYLRFGRMRSPMTTAAEVRQVKPAEIVLLRRHKIFRRRYWRWTLGERTVAEASPSAFDRVFRDAICRQTDCDVPFGLFLSGGLDSSLVAAVARDLYPVRDLKSFTIRFKESSYDEGESAGKLASRLKLDHSEVWVGPQDFPETLRALVRLVGEPLADPAWVPTAILSRRAARDVKLVLIGEGADETFGGYPTYIGANLSAVYRRLPSALRHILSGAIRRLPPSDRKTTVSYLLKRFMEGCSETGIAQHASWTSVMPGAVLQWLGIPRFDLPGDSSGDAVERAQRHDFENMLGDGLLTKTDRAAMSVGLEPRAPFLDPAILRFAAELPTRERVHRWRTKVFLKRYAERYLPARFVHQRKRGLSVPLSGWLRGPLRGWARERLGSGLIARCGISIPAVLDLLDDHLLRREDFARPLWALLVLTEWLEWWEERTLPVASRLPRAQSSERRSVLR